MNDPFLTIVALALMLRGAMLLWELLE